MRKYDDNKAFFRLLIAAMLLTLMSAYANSKNPKPIIESGVKKVIQLKGSGLPPVFDFS